MSSSSGWNCGGAGTSSLVLNIALSGPYNVASMTGMAYSR